MFFGNIVLHAAVAAEQWATPPPGRDWWPRPPAWWRCVLSPLVGRLIGRFDPRWLAAARFVILRASPISCARGFTADASFVAFVLPQLVQGIGMGLFFVSMLAMMLDGLPPQKIPAASGLSNFLRIIAGGFATSLTTTFWDRREALHQTRLAETSSVLSPSLQQSLHGLNASRRERSGRRRRDDPGSDRSRPICCRRSISSGSRAGCR